MSAASISNGSKLAVQFQVQVGTELELLQCVLPYKKTKQDQTRSFLAGSTFSLTQIFGSKVLSLIKWDYAVQ